MATCSSDGHFTIIDRKKDAIIRGGYNVYPREVEEALYEHPAVAEAAVVGIPHQTLGEKVAAAVALEPGEVAEPEELTRFVRGRVAASKSPRRIWLVEALPKGSPARSCVARSVRRSSTADGPITEEKRTRWESWRVRSP